MVDLNNSRKGAATEISLNELTGEFKIVSTDLEHGQVFTFTTNMREVPGEGMAGFVGEFEHIVMESIQQMHQSVFGKRTDGQGKKEGEQG